MANTVIKNYVDFETLSYYDQKAKARMQSADAEVLKQSKEYADSLAVNYDAAGTAQTKVDELANGQVKTNTEAIESLDNYVGTLPETTMVTNVIDYIDEKCGNLENVYTPITNEQIDALFGELFDDNKDNNIEDGNGDTVSGLYDADGAMLCSWEDSGIDASVNYTENNYKTETTSGYYVITNNYPNTTKVVIPKSVTSIGCMTFRGCSSLTSIELLEGVEEIIASCFYECTNLVDVKLPNSLNSIGAYAFYNCTKLTSIPKNIPNIDAYAFRGCNGLIDITIPESVTSIGAGAFMDCANLTSVTLSSGMTDFSHQMFRNCAKLNSINIPESITTIGNYVCSGCTALTSVTIPKNVTSIGIQAFSNCTNLKSATFNNPNNWYVGDKTGEKTTALDSSYLSQTGYGAVYLKNSYVTKYWTRAVS